MDANQQHIPSNESPSGEKRRACGMRRGSCRGGALFVLVAALLVGAAGGYVGKTFAQGPFSGHLSMVSAIDPAKVDTHVERMIKHFAVEVDATPAQREKLNVIAKAAAHDLLPMHDKLQAARQQAIALAGGQSVDRAGMEKLRSEQIALADIASKRMTLALADAAEVLTPQQRQKIAGHMKDRGERRHRWNRG